MVVHGANLSSQNLAQLAMRLADAFTVYVPDRGGRGLSGPYGEDYGIRKEVEDLEALLNLSGASLSSGSAQRGLLRLKQHVPYRQFARLPFMNPRC